MISHLSNTRAAEADYETRRRMKRYDEHEGQVPVKIRFCAVLLQRRAGTSPLLSTDFGG